MDLLRKVFGLREDQERLIIMPLLFLIFLIILFSLRGCVPGRDAGELTLSGVGDVLPAASAPVIKDSDTNNVQLAGSYLPNDRVDLYIDGEFVERVETDRLGLWTYETTLPNGSHNLRIVAQRDGGTVESTTYPFVVRAGGSIDSDRSAVNYLPRIGESETLNGVPIEDPRIDSSIDGMAVTSGRVALSGRGTPGSQVIVTANGRTLGRILVGDDGRWALNSNFNEPGDYEIAVRSVESPNRPIGTANITIGKALQTPTIELNRDRSTDRNVVRLIGTGAPNSELGIMINGQLAYFASTDADGNWALDVNVEPDATELEFVAMANDEGALEAVFSTPTRLKRAALSPEPTAEAAGVAMITFDPLTTESADFDITDGLASGDLNLSGAGDPVGAQVVVLLNDTQLGDTTIDTSGQWNFGTEVNLSPGTYQLSAELRDTDGTVLAVSDTTTLIIPEGENEPTTVTLSDDGFDLNDATFADDGTATGTIELVGNVEPAGSRIIFYLNDEEIGELVSADGGEYNFSYDYELAPGTYQITTRIVDENGAALAESTSRTIDILEPAMEDAEVAPSSLRVVFAGLGGGSGDDSGDADDSDGDETGTGDDLANSTLPAVELIVDASWSMTLDMSGENRLTSDDADSRIAIAREALNTLVDELPDDLPIAVRGFGNRAAEYECQTELEQSLQLLDRDTLRATLLGIEPQLNANTPIAQSLNFVAQDLANFGGQRRVVLLTDGEENCGGSPAGAIQTLRNSGIDVTIDIVGFAIGDPALQAQFESWAELGGGVYYNADNAEALAAALQSAVVVSYRVLDADGEEVATGIVGGAAVELPTGTYTVEVLSAPIEQFEVEVGEEPTVLTLE